METSSWKRGTLVLCYDLRITHHTYVTCSTASEIRKALVKIKQLSKLPLLQQSSAKPQPSQESYFLLALGPAPTKMALMPNTVWI